MLVEFHVFSATDGLVILGTTSESTTLTEKEKDDIVRFVVSKNNFRMKIVVAVITNNTLEAIERSVKYEKMGADYLLLITPFYNKTNAYGLINHFKLIAESVNIPIILYNVPSRSGMNIDVDTLKILKQIPNIVGIKECSKDIDHIIKVSNICDHYFHLYCGNDELGYLFLSLGATGIINVYGNLEPQLMKDIINVYEINPFLARRFFNDFYELLTNVFIEVNPIPIKTLMNYIGMDVGGCRLPLYTMREENYLNLITLYDIKNYYHKRI